MAVEKSYARFGLFLVVVLAVALVTAAIVINRLRTREVIAFVTYTTDNVSGLDISRPVRFRGVTIGQVTDVRVDPRNVSVEIDFDVELDHLVAVGMDVHRLESRVAEGALEALRTQVISNPVTGEAYVLIDAPVNPPPPMTLGFTPAKPYIASMPTPLATAASRLPEVLESAETTLKTLTEIIARIPASLDRTDRFFTNVDKIIRESNLPELSGDSRKFFTTTTEEISQMTVLMSQMTVDIDKMLGTGGDLAKFAADTRSAIVAADLPATTESTRRAMDEAAVTADELRRSLPVIRDSLQQLRELARQLQEQPESVVYGRRPVKGKGSQ